jgi:hypothetical protein
MRMDNKSGTTARYEPALCRPDVANIGQPLLVRPIGLEIPVEDGTGDSRAVAIVLGVSAQLLPRSHSLAPHQPLDPARSAGEPLFERVMPDAAGALGARLCWHDADGKMAVELLMLGTQWVLAPTIHPDTQMPYVW